MTTAQRERPPAAPLNLYQKLAKISGDLGAIAKDSQAPDEMGGFKFMSHGALLGHLRAALAAHNVMVFESLAVISDDAVTLITRRGERSARRIVVKLTALFVDADEPDVRHAVEWYGEGLDTADKAMQKAGTSAEKYLLSKTFKVSDRDDPDAAEGPGELTGQPDRARAGGFTSPRQAREQPPQGHAGQSAQASSKAAEPGSELVCPRCNKAGAVRLRASGGGAFCAVSKATEDGGHGCGSTLSPAEVTAAQTVARGATEQPEQQTLDGAQAPEQGAAAP